MWKARSDENVLLPRHIEHSKSKDSSHFSKNAHLAQLPESNIVGGNISAGMVIMTAHYFEEKVNSQKPVHMKCPFT